MSIIQMLISQIDKLKSNGNDRRIININTENINIMQFNLTNEQKIKLMDLGYEKGKLHLKKNKWFIKIIKKCLM